MSRVMAVSFERYGRLHYLDPGTADYRVGDKVLVPTETGPEVAECVWAPEYATDAEVLQAELPVCAGLAEEADLLRDAAHKRRKAEAKLLAKRLVRRHDLAMKVVAVDVVGGGGQHGEDLIAIYFSAPHRIDFRRLVGDLARSLQARIDLRQIGSRDVARLTGGLGSCGRELCCATFLTDIEPVSLRMAKAQDLPANPMRISGACGRLMCCLKYEHPLYQEFHRTTPSVGAEVETPDGPATVLAHQVPADAVLVRNRASGAVSSCSRAGVCGSRAAYTERSEPGPAREEPSTPTPAAPSAPEPRKPRQRRRR